MNALAGPSVLKTNECGPTKLTSFWIYQSTQFVEGIYIISSIGFHLKRWISICSNPTYKFCICGGGWPTHVILVAHGRIISSFVGHGVLPCADLKPPPRPP